MPVGHAAREPGAFRHPGSSTGRAIEDRAVLPPHFEKTRGVRTSFLINGYFSNLNINPLFQLNRPRSPRDLRSRGFTPRFFETRGHHTPNN